MNYDTYYYSNYLYHHGIKGQKWGVRRYQNPDGSRTAEGKKQRAKLTTKQKRTIALVAAGALVAGAVGYYAYTHPDKVLKVITKVKYSKVANIGSSAVKAGKKFVNSATVKTITEGVKEGVKESLKDAPKKATKVVLTGATLYATKKVLDQVVGQDKSDAIFKANDPKQIGKFWKVNNGNNNQRKDEDE